MKMQELWMYFRLKIILKDYKGNYVEINLSFYER